MHLLPFPKYLFTSNRAQRSQNSVFITLFTSWERTRHQNHIITHRYLFNDLLGLSHLAAISLLPLSVFNLLPPPEQLAEAIGWGMGVLRSRGDKRVDPAWIASLPSWAVSATAGEGRWGQIFLLIPSWHLQSRNLKVSQQEEMQKLMVTGDVYCLLC